MSGYEHGRKNRSALVGGPSPLTTPYYDSHDLDELNYVMYTYHDPY